jgi:hypothetical protein
MKKIIERYIYAVTKRLPENMREEVKEELNGNIHDMLSKDPTDEEIDKVLHELGHPRELARNYRGQDRYVISPLFYDDYIQVLKIVAIIFVAVSLVFGTFDAIIHVEATSVIGVIAEVFAKIISNSFSAFVNAFAWTTLIFWIIDYAVRNKKLPEWKLNDLPDLPSPKTTKISRVETLLGLVLGTAFSAVFIIFLVRYIDLVGIYENGVIVAQIFNPEVTNQFIVFFIISAVLGFIVSLMKLNFGEWRISLAIVYTAQELMSSILFIIFIRMENLILNEAFVKVGSYLDLTGDVVRSNFEKGVTGLTVFIIIVTIIDLISTWIKTLKHKKA